MQLHTILIEDNPTIRDSLVAAMQEVANVDVVSIAETADEGISTLRAHAADWQLVVLDIFLRSGTGFDVLRAARDRRAGQHIVVISNYATAEMRRRVIEAGADAVFDKSTEIEAFLERCLHYADEAASAGAR